MDNWKNILLEKLTAESNKIVELNLETREIRYSEKIKHHRTLKKITGDEELVRASLINRLVNDLDYKPENIETEKDYTIKGGHGKLNPRIDTIVKDDKGNPYFFIETKSPNKYEEDKDEIEGQLFSLAQAEEKDYNTNVKYLVYYTVEEVEEQIIDRALIIDFEKFKTYSEWENSGFVSIGTELSPGYGQPKKQPLIKGNNKYDLKVRINRKEIEGLSRNLHNVLWGGGGTNDSEIFYSLVNIILAKIQDEYEKEDEEEYDFQVYQYGTTVESQQKLYDRINNLYKRALTEQLNVSEKRNIEEDNIINRNKFPLNKLVFTVQELESFSFLEGRSSLDGKDILGDFFESITRDGFKQTKGQFFTPTPIVNFLLYALKLDQMAIEKLNSDKELPLIMDPSAGSGTYLVEAMKIITRELKSKQKSKIKSSRQIERRFEELFTPDYNENKWAREYLYGSEINFDLGTASKVNMILHGDGATNIFVQDGLLPFRFFVKESAPNYLENANPEPLYNNKEVNGKFDVVVSNPPFSVDLDTQTQKEVKNTFLFGNKKNSENLFIERYYQLLKENGRLGIVLPESVFDTTENKYIRLFIFKYFNVKAVVSLPQSTFEPYTSTKTSLLFAQKKKSEDVHKWNELWAKYGNEWSLLKTRVKDYYSYYVENKALNNKWAKDVIEDIEYNNVDNILKNAYRFLKDYITEEDDILTVKELLTKYSEEIFEVSKFEKETDIFGFYNAWWVFGEVAKDLNYEVLMAEAKNVGYKRTKRGEKPMPNDLYDLEYAPTKLNVRKILDEYEESIYSMENKIEEMKIKKKDLEEKYKSSKTKGIKIRIDKIEQESELLSTKISELNNEMFEITEITDKYYENDTLKQEFLERNEEELLHHFKYGLLSNYVSNDIVLRHNTSSKILDTLRQEVEWE